MLGVGSLATIAQLTKGCNIPYPARRVLLPTLVVSKNSSYSEVIATDTGLEYLESFSMLKLMVTWYTIYGILISKI